MTTEADVIELDDYRRLSVQERDAQQFKAIRVAALASTTAAKRTLDLHTDLGVLIAALTENTAALKRNSTVIETMFGAAAAKIALQAAAESVAAAVPSPKPPKSLHPPPMRDKFPSYLEEHPEDDQRSRELKQKMLETLIEERIATGNVVAWWGRLFNRLKLGGGVVLIVIALLAALWGVVKYAINQAHGSPQPASISSAAPPHS